MNKPYCIRNFLLVLACILSSILLYLGREEFLYIEFFYVALMICYSYLSIRNAIRKVKLSKKFYWLCNLILSIQILILLRSLCESNFVFLDATWDNIESLTKPFNIARIYYFCQNIPFFVLLYSLLFGCYCIEMGGQKKYVSSYSKISLITFWASLLSLPCVVSTFGFQKQVLFLGIFHVILLIIEIWTLINYHGRKKEWPILLSFIMNGVVFIFVVLHLLAG